MGFLTRMAGRGDGLTLPVCGYGEGDMWRRIARWAAERGVVAELVGIARNPGREMVARADTPADAPITPDLAANSDSTLMNAQGASSPAFTAAISASTMCVCGEMG